MIQLFLATPENLWRCPSIVPLIVHLMTRPVAPHEPIKRKAMLEADKLTAEGAPAESQRVLGWIIDTRKLLLQLPKDKKIAWTKEVSTLLRTRCTTFDAFRRLIGKLQHAVKGIPLAGFWLARMREYQTFLERSFQQKQQNKQKLDEINNDTSRPRNSHRDTPPPFYRYTVLESIIPDLEMWTHLLSHAHEGISLNRLVCRVPTHLFHADSCPEGMGGYSARSGRAWRCKIDKTQLDQLRNMKNCDPTRSNNLFEFIAIVESVWVDCWFHEVHPDDAVFALTDNSSAVGWMYKTSFGSDKPLHVEVAEKLTRLVFHHKFALHTEHIPGKQNDVSSDRIRARSLPRLPPSYQPQGRHRMFLPPTPPRCRLHAKPRPLEPSSSKHYCASPWRLGIVLQASR